jgi:D-alanyl-D-alanine-carboxypeptidase/D-alanyl-D-alanine-endopeptidase
MKTPRKILSSSLLLILFLSTSSYGPSRLKLPDDVVNSIEKRIEFGLNPSIVVGIIDKDGPHYFNFGKKSDNGTEANEHTIYEIGSITKVFTATLLSQQVIDGKLKLDDAIKNYLPSQVKIPQWGANEITFGNLSDHTSGLPRLPSNMSPSDPGNPYADYTVDQMYSFLSGYKLTRDVGSAYEYSNLAQGLLGHILALNAGVTYESLMIKTIARPLGMKETKITLDKKMKKNLAIGHDKGVVAKNWDLPTLAGAGAIRSSTHDMIKFISANLGFLNTSLQAAMKKTHEVRHDKAGSMRVGLGWHIAKGKNGDVIWHNGGTGGYMAFAGFVKESGEGVVLLTNSTESIDDIGFHLLNPESPLRIIKPSIASEIRKTIDVNGVEAARTLFNDIKKNKPDEYNISEADINALGYSYMDKNLTAALAIFKMNIDMYPNSSNVYDSYGEALLKNGDKDLAIENYKKSLELNPANINGIQALEKLGVKIQTENAEVPEAILDTYVGSYELNPGFNILITRNGKQLFGQATGQGKFELYAKSNREFYLKVVNAQIIFNVNEQAAVENLTLIQNGQKITGKKVN